MQFEVKPILQMMPTSQPAEKISSEGFFSSLLSVNIFLSFFFFFLLPFFLSILLRLRAGRKQKKRRALLFFFKFYLSSTSSNSSHRSLSLSIDRKRIYIYIRLRCALVDWLVGLRASSFSSSSLGRIFLLSSGYDG